MAKDLRGLTNASTAITLGSSGQGPVVVPEDLRGGGIGNYTTTERDAISGQRVDNNMIIYNTTTTQYERYSGGTRAATGFMTGGTWSALQLGEGGHASIQVYADNTTYAVGEIVVDTANNSLYRVTTAITITNNTTSPSEGNSSFTRISNPVDTTYTAGTGINISGTNVISVEALHASETVVFEAATLAAGITARNAARTGGWAQGDIAVIVDNDPNAGTDFDSHSYIYIGTNTDSDQTENFTGDGTTTTFTVSHAISALGTVTVAGSSVSGSTFSGSVVTLTAAPASGAAVVITYTPLTTSQDSDWAQLTFTTDTTYTAGTGLTLTGTTFSVTDGGVDTTQLADGAVTNVKIADDSIAEVKLDIHNTPSDGNILEYDTTNGMQWVAPSAVAGIGDGTVTIAGDVTASTTFTLNQTGNADVNLTINDNAVDAAALADDAVDTAAIVDDAVTNAKIADNAVANAQLADDAVTAAEIADNAVGAAALNVSGNGTEHQLLASDGDGTFSWVSPGSDHGVNDAVITLSGDVTGSSTFSVNQAANETINLTINDNAVDAAALADDAVDTAAIVDDAVTSDKIADNAVGAAALNVSGNGTTHQLLASDGDGTFSWVSPGADHGVYDTIQVFATGTAYAVDDFVYYDTLGTLYRVVTAVDSSNAMTPNNLASFREITGTITTYRDSTAYALGELVFYYGDNNIYRVTTAVTNTNTEDPNSSSSFTRVTDDSGIPPLLSAIPRDPRPSDATVLDVPVPTANITAGTDVQWTLTNGNINTRTATVPTTWAQFFGSGNTYPAIAPSSTAEANRLVDVLNEDRTRILIAYRNINNWAIWQFTGTTNLATSVSFGREVIVFGTATNGPPLASIGTPGNGDIDWIFDVDSSSNAVDIIYRSTEDLYLVNNGTNIVWTHRDDARFDLHDDVTTALIGNIAFDDRFVVSDESATGDPNSWVDFQTLVGSAGPLLDGRYEPRFSHAVQPLDSLPTGNYQTGSTPSTTRTGSTTSADASTGWGFINQTANFTGTFVTQPSTWAGFFGSSASQIIISNGQFLSGFDAISGINNGTFSNANRQHNVYLLGYRDATNWAIWQWTGGIVSSHAIISNGGGHRPILVNQQGTPGTTGIRWIFNFVNSISGGFNATTAVNNDGTDVRLSNDTWGPISNAQLSGVTTPTAGQILSATAGNDTTGFTWVDADAQLTRTNIDNAIGDTGVLLTTAVFQNESNESIINNTGVNELRFFDGVGNPITNREANLSTVARIEFHPQANTAISSAFAQLTTSSLIRLTAPAIPAPALPLTDNAIPARSLFFRPTSVTIASGLITVALTTASTLEIDDGDIGRQHGFTPSADWTVSIKPDASLIHGEEIIEGTIPFNRLATTAVAEIREGVQTDNPRLVVEAFRQAETRDIYYNTDNTISAVQVNVGFTAGTDITAFYTYNASGDLTHVRYYTTSLVSVNSPPPTDTSLPAYVAPLATKTITYNTDGDISLVAIT